MSEKNEINTEKLKQWLSAACNDLVVLANCPKPTPSKALNPHNFLPQW